MGAVCEASLWGEGGADESPGGHPLAASGPMIYRFLSVVCAFRGPCPPVEDLILKCPTERC